MSTICADQHKFYSCHQLFPSNTSKPFKDLDIPPRKLLTKTPKFEDLSSPHEMSPYEANLRKYLPCNDYSSIADNNNKTDADYDDDMDPYASDHFRMYEFKVRRCTRSRSHDWTDCPFAHPGEKARRRDPRLYHYSGTVCPEFRRGSCSRGDNCEFAHGVFECWLHPSRYRTEACKDGKNCKRKVCFFAHSPRELRILPEINTCGSRKYERGYINGHSHCCCLVCQSVASSPTSTLMGLSHISPPLSPSLSPPLSPVKNRSFSGLSPVSRYSDRFSKLGSEGTSKDALIELMTSLEAMSVADVGGCSSSPSTRNSVAGNPWIDVPFSGEDQPQFILSPSTPNPPVGSANFFRNGSSKSYIDNYNINAHDHSKSYIDNYNINAHAHVHGGTNGGSDPDLGWVNDLLM